MVPADESRRGGEAAQRPPHERVSAVRAEAAHEMTFPCLRAGRVARETHHALLFQRTMILDAARPDGGFLTWVLDPRGRAAADQRVDAYLLVVNGWGVHPEGVANLTAALIRYNPHRFREPPPDVVPYADTKDAYC